MRILNLIWSGVCLIVFLSTGVFQVHADNEVHPYRVIVPLPGEDPTAHKRVIEYKPLAEAQKKWSLFVSLPHMKDSYWLAVNFGLISEAVRLGVRLQLEQAGGYDHLESQISQIRKHVDSGAEGVIIGAISYNGLDDLISDLAQKGIPVIDLVNGISSNHVSARSLVSFEEMGYRTAEYLVNRHANSEKPIKLAWFPGPRDAGWVKAGDRGFRKGLNGSPIQIVASRYGDTGKAVQTALIEEVLDEHADIDYVAGTAVTASAAVRIIRKRNLSHRIQIISYYFSPEVYAGIKRGRILAAPTDSAVIQGRIAVDQLVRILEHKPFLKQAGPQIYIIDSSNIMSFDRVTSLAPSGFRATYSANVQRMTE